MLPSAVPTPSATVVRAKARLEIVVIRDSQLARADVVNARAGSLYLG
jgi:hypothetical protein